LLARLARHKDPQVRAQALICIRAAGGPEATPTALAALDDDDASVVAHAIQVLQVFPPRDDKPLLAAYERQQETRDQIALVAGRLGTNANVSAWKTQLRTSAPGTSVADALLAAVARMGDADARKEFTARLEAARGRDAQPWIDRAIYEGQPWVLEPLARLLDRKERALELTPDDPSDLRPLRTCDLAANAILRLTGAKAVFPAPRDTPYTDTELAEFRRLAAEAFRKGQPSSGR
jgi:HEAT repeat protein